MWYRIMKCKASEYWQIWYASFGAPGRIYQPRGEETKRRGTVKGKDRKKTDKRKIDGQKCTGQQKKGSIRGEKISRVEA